MFLSATILDKWKKHDLFFYIIGFIELSQFMITLTGNIFINMI